MAVAIDLFSIREYAEKMRRIDMGKCWPFACEGREVKGRSLPPISLRKFRWWADELESVRVNDEPAKVSVAEDTFPTTARAGGRGKQKVPKKRSIVELFAVAPQIDAIEEDDNGEDEEREDLGDGEQEEVLERGERNVGFDLDEEVQERNHGEHAVIRRKQARLKPIQKEKKKKKLITSKKVKSHTSKSPSAGVISPISECFSRKTKLKDHICEHTKKKRAKVSKTGQNCKSIRAPKFACKKHDDCRKAPPLRSILKNRITSNKKTTVLASRLRGHHINSIGELIKHVSFSDKDDRLGPNNIATSKELPQLQTLCKVLFSDILSASAAIKNSSKDEKHSVGIEGPQVEEENMDVSVSSIRLADRTDSEKNHSSDAYGLTDSTTDPNSSNCPDKVKNKIENFDLNNNIQMHSTLSLPMANNSSSLHCHQDSTNRQILDSSYNVDLSSNIRNHPQKNTSSASAISSNSFHCRNCVSSSNSAYPQTVARNPVMQSSRSFMVCNMQNDSDSSQPPTVSNITESRPTYLSSKYFLSSNCSPVGSIKFMELMRASDPMFFTREKITNEDFIGLPLNSQGELVKLDSGCKFGFNNSFKTHNTAPGSFHGSFVPTHMDPTRNIAQEKMKERFSSEPLDVKDLLRVLPKQYCSYENHLTSSRDIAELQNFEGMEAKKLEPVQSKDLFEVSSNACNLPNYTCQADRATYHPGMDCGISVAQPTMRLMGTTVTIGEISKENKSSDGAKVWTDKKITNEQCPGASVYLGTYSDQWPKQEKSPPSALWAPQEKLKLSSRDHQSLHHIPLVRPKLDRHQSQMAIGPSSTIVNHVPTDNNTKLHCHPSQASLHLTQQPLVHCSSMRSSIESVHAKPAVTSVSRDISHQLPLNSTHCKHTQSLSSIKSSTSNPSPRNNTPGCFAEPSAVFSSPYHSQWLINAKEPLNSQIIPFIRYPTPYNGYHPCTIPGTNFLSHPSPCSQPLIALPVYNIQTSNTCGSSTSASLGHHSFVPGCSVNTSISANNSIQVSKPQNRDGPKSKIAYLSAWNHGHKTKKRVAEKGHEFIRPLKKANVILPVKSCSISGPVGRVQPNMFHPRNAGTTGVLHQGNETRNPDTQFLGYKNNEYRCFFDSSSKYHRGMIAGHVQFSRPEKNVLKPSQNMNSTSFRPIYSSRVGPVRLRAGAKHILEPCRSSDQKNSRLIHSAMPLVDGNASSRIVVSHRKLEEIYSF